MATILPAELARLRASDAPHALLDVRERGAYETGHIFRATSLPRRLLEFRLPALVTARDTPIVLYDTDGALAALARPTVLGMGYRDVRVLEGGLAAWRAAGRPTVQGVNVPSKVFGERMQHARATPEISPGDLRARLARGDDLVIVDARTPEEYARGCIPGAWSVPGGELVLQIPDLVSRPDTTIVVHCGGRTRSYIGTESLRRMGLPNPVVALRNGTMGWELAGFELERGASRWAPPASAGARALAARVAKRVAAEDGVGCISPDELRSLWDRRDRRNVRLLDVRTAEEYVAGHVPGATWAPGGQVVQATDDYVAVRAGAIVLTCDDLTRSVMTAAWLLRMGFPDVLVLEGGLRAWEDSGGAVERAQPDVVPHGYEKVREEVVLAGPGEWAPEALILDVDQSDVYARGHVPGAGWLCRSRLETRIAGIAPDRGQPIVVTCATGYTATLAAVTLGRMGYKAVRVLDGGTRAWEAGGRPLERGRTRLLDESDDIVLKPYEKGREAMEAYLRWEETLSETGESLHGLR